MFGIDDIGLLLGAVSLLIAVVQDSKKIARYLRLFKDYQAERLKLITELCTQQHLLELAITRPLAPLLAKEEIERLCRDASSPAWKNTQLTVQLQTEYHPSILAVFENSRSAIAASSSKFLASIGCNRFSLPGGLSSFEALTRARAQTEHSLVARASFASRTSSIKEYFENIRSAIQDIHLAMSSLPDRVSQSRQRHQKWLSSIRRTRQYATRVHEVLSQHVVQCRHPTHGRKTYFALSSSSDWSEPGQEQIASLGDARRFDLLLEDQNHWMPANVLICSSHSARLPHDAKAASVSADACMLVTTKNAAGRRGCRANIDNQIVSATITRVMSASATTVARQAQTFRPTTKVTLLSLLPHRARLSDFARVAIAANIADSVAHLAGSPWLTPDVSKKDIAFFDGPHNLAPGTGPPQLHKAYLSRNLRPGPMNQQAPALYSSAYYQTMVLKICVWMLELSAADDRGYDCNSGQSLPAIIAKCYGWLEELQRSQNGVILDAALGCLQLAMNPALSFTDREKDLEEYRSKVMVPLRAADRALHPLQ
ncbi:hypothetical protein LTR95_014505 [Oleoguttula sp. CCFEE 5521]